MKISDIALQVRTSLNTWAATKGGKAEVAGDFAHLFAILSAKPGAVRAAVFIPGEDKRGENEEASVVDRKFSVFISRGRGFALEPGDSHVRATAGAGAPLFDLVEEAREVVRALSFDADYTEVTADYLGFRVAELPSDTPLDAYELNFQLGCTLNAPAAGAAAAPASGGVHAGLGNMFAVASGVVSDVPSGLEVYDDWNAFSFGVFTAPAQGIYLIEAAYYTPDLSGFEWSLQIASGSVAQLEARDTRQNKHISTALKLNAGATIKVRVVHQTGVPRDFGGSPLASEVNFFKAHRIS